MLYRAILNVRFQKGTRCALSLVSEVNFIALILRRAFSGKYFILTDTDDKTGLDRT